MNSQISPRSNATVRSEVCRKRSGFGTRPLSLATPFHPLLADGAAQEGAAKTMLDELAKWTGRWRR
jgi:hypothetical protein